ncbi:MAG: glycosyltransferase family 4 protein [Desulfuromonadaceae bacterium]
MKKRITIAYCYPEPLPSDQARSIQVMNTCCALAAQVERVIFYLPAGQSSIDDIFSFYGLTQPANLEIRRLRTSLGPLKSNRFFNRSLQKHLKTDVPDLIISRHLKTANGLLKLSTPVIFEAHEVFSTKQAQAVKNRMLEQRVFAQARGIMYLSRPLAQTLEAEYAPKATVAIVPSGTEVPPTLPEKNTPGERFLVTYMGTTRYAWKGVATLFDAMEYLPDRIGLEIIGSLDPSLASHRMVAPLSAAGRLEVTGHLPPQQAHGRLLQARVAVVPNSGLEAISRYYTSPLKLLEAMAAGAAIVASDLPSIREIVTEKEAILVTPDDPKALAEGIRSMVEDLALRRELTHRAWLRVQDFSWPSRAKKIVNLAHEVLRHDTA